MAQQNINFGTFPDDPDADAIRTAFQKVQQNFTEVYRGVEGTAVASINKTPGAGITVTQPTGNVVICRTGTPCGCPATRCRAGFGGLPRTVPR